MDPTTAIGSVLASFGLAGAAHAALRAASSATTATLANPVPSRVRTPR
jgi:hypothetical protein